MFSQNGTLGTDDRTRGSIGPCSLRGARRASGLALAGWALAIQIGAAGAAGALQAQSCTCSVVPGLPENPDVANAQGGRGDRPWWLFLLPAGAAGLLAGLPGGAAAVPAAGAPALIESGGEVALPAAPLAEPVVGAPPAVPVIEPKAKSDKRIPVGKDGKPQRSRGDTARAATDPPAEPTVPAPFLLGGLSLGAGAWTVLLKGSAVKAKLLVALRSLV